MIETSNSYVNLIYLLRRNKYIITCLRETLLYFDGTAVGGEDRQSDGEEAFNDKHVLLP